MYCVYNDMYIVCSCIEEAGGKQLVVTEQVYQYLKLRESAGIAVDSNISQSNGCELVASKTNNGNYLIESFERYILIYLFIYFWGGGGSNYNFI